MRDKARTAQEEPVLKGPGVSELLKTTRERAGQDLQVISQVLRIRHVYLQAIEDGRYDDLPGKTYVVGFVRAYSDHLGLDAEEVVKRFKEEVDGLEGRSELMFPSPVTEQSVPGGAIIMIGLVILASAYGGWYFLSSQDRSMAELVPDLPAKFTEMVERVKDISGAEETAPAQEQAAMNEATPPTEPVEEAAMVSETDAQVMAQKAMESLEKAKIEEAPVEQVVETVKLEETTAGAVEETVETVEQEATDVQTPEQVTGAEEESAQTQVQETTDVASQVEDPTPAEEEVEEAAVVEEEPTPPEVVEAEETTTTEAAAAEVETAAVEEAPAEEPAPVVPQVMDEEVLLKAVDYSWIQVTQTDGTVVHTQVLNAGEQYQIPAKPGLILRTGNAGGLEIYVDGEKAPSIGAAGEVRRKVLMSPEKLLAGNAVES